MLKQASPVIHAALWMTGALLSFTGMAIAGRELSAELNTFQILFFRSVISLFIISCILQHSGWAQIRTTKFSDHMIRNISHFGGQFGWFYGLAFIPLSQVFAIEFTLPIWTLCFAALLLNEKITPPRLIAIALGFTGMLVILQPGFNTVEPAAFAVLAGAVCYAFAYIKTKQLAHIDTPLCILFYMTVIQLPIGLIPALIDWKLPSITMLPWVLLVGVTALSAHYCITRAMQQADASIVVPMDFLRLPLITVIGFLLYGESIEWAVLFGALIMLSGNYINVRAEQRKTLK